MRGKPLILGFICLFASIAIMSCKPAMQKGDVSSDAFTASMIANVRPVDQIKVKAKVRTGLGGVKVTWSQVSRARSFIISRHEGDGNWQEIDTLSPENTSYIDETAKAGMTYYYMVEAPCEYNDTDRFAYDVDQMPDVLEDECSVYTGVGEAYWTNKLSDKKKIKLGSVMLEYAFGEKDQGGMDPEGVEIYRGSTKGEYSLLERGMVEDYASKDYDFAKNYIDTTVEQGRTYYYQVRAFAMLKGKRVYGKKSKPLRIISAEPEGIYTISVAKEPGTYNNTMILALTSAARENGTLTLSAASLQSGITMLYQLTSANYMASVRPTAVTTTTYQSAPSPTPTQEASVTIPPYQSVKMRASRVSNDGNYFNSVVQDIVLEPEKTIYIEVTPEDPQNKMWASTSLTMAQFYLPAQYNEGKHSLQLDVKSKKAVLVDKDAGGMFHTWMETTQAGRLSSIKIGMISTLRENKKVVLSSKDLSAIAYEYQNKGDDSLKSLPLTAVLYSTDGITWEKPGKSITVDSQDILYLKLVPADKKKKISYQLKGQRHGDLVISGTLVGKTKKEWKMTVNLLKNTAETN